ncbi:sigma-70 family RNA polymerase sigma factor [Flavivirga aquimarina]|uniref:Sigma-70 family RNA polymerase sigma factor n=1 Tax=Flavivirga aquimarina TaxID=2027862 RepID=A0ABT8W5W5_9FLAO|nr:sigma-70 family RNA polymerase sigma factor [Flavivirga aquimarina]MDO5968496.1 sigma-70 family RNA polymerase sigma factor [Flavivirga aquimarina]
MPKSYSNTELIKLLKNGNEDAYTYLVTFYHKPLFVYALSLTNDDSSAKDIVQNVFLKTWEHRKKLNPKHLIKSFLYKTTYNEFINQYHKNRRVSILEREYIEALDEIVDDNNLEILVRKINLITDGITHLPRKCKDTFLLSKKEGLTNIEIAEYHNVSVRTVEWQLNKAYNLLRKRLGDELKSILFLLFRRNSVRDEV